MPNLRGDGARVGELVELRLLEADAEGLGTRAQLRHGADDAGGVDAAGEERADRDVGDEVRLDGVAQERAHLDGGFALVDGARRFLRPQIPVARDRQLAAAVTQDVAGRQLAHTVEDRLIRRRGAERQIVRQRLGRDGAAHVGMAEQRLELAAEDQPARRGREVERLDAEAIARQHQLVALAIPHGEAEHAGQRLDDSGAALLEEMDDDLGVAGGGEAVAARQRARSRNAR